MMLTDGISITSILLISVLTICTITDLKSRKIYNAILLPALLVAIMWHTWTAGIAGIAHTLGGLFVGLLILLIPYMLGGMGAGDVKLLAVIGAIQGVNFVLWTALYMALIGGILALIIVLFRKDFLQIIKNIFYILGSLRLGVRVPISLQSGVQNSHTTYPYGVAISLGALFTLIVGSGGWWLL